MFSDRTRWRMLGAMLAIATGIAGCSKKNDGESGPGTLEKVGKKVDDAAENAGKKLDDAAKKTGEYVSDSAITAQVKTALALNKEIDATAISVTTTDGVVTLTGTVANTRIKTEAAFIAGSIRGAKRVVSNLEVRP
ncbi:MAG: BON domain-containing protein [Planctomycetes bacterium]|nr:BON domain-containing protein [Planctomycetota bacterium]MBI3847115.1 BON domain-containing protein [Planctomycetota bacterium]